MATVYKTNQYFTTTLNVGGGIDDSQTSGIVIADDSGIDDVDEPGIALINYADPLNTSIAEWVTYTSISSKELQGVTRGAEGFAAKAHDNGVAVAFPISMSHINNLAEALAIGGVPTNAVTTTLDEDAMGSNSATALATQQSIKAYVDSGTVSMTNKTLSGSTNVVESESLTNTVSFFAYKTTAGQSISNTTYTKITFDAETYDTGSDYDHATNHVFTAPVTGLYYFASQANLVTVADATLMFMAIEINGTREYRIGAAQAGGAADIACGGSMILKLSANDTVGVQIYHNDGSAEPTGFGDEYVWFCGYLIAKI